MSLFNLPNRLTSLRLVLSFVLFLFIDLRLWGVALAVFVIAAFTDWLDGYLARKQGLTSSLGRVYDPLVDKILICGAFVFLLRVHGSKLPGDAGLNAWMVTIVITREFIVTGLRGFLEERGVAFGADLLGKFKMLLQCGTLVWILAALLLAEHGAGTGWLVVTRNVVNWSMVGVTFLSGANYVLKAIKHLR